MAGYRNTCYRYYNFSNYIMSGRKCNEKENINPFKKYSQALIGIPEGWFSSSCTVGIKIGKNIFFSIYFVV